MINFEQASRVKLPGRQQGAILVISMVLLLVLTLLGVSSMDTTGLEMKMASNNRDRQVALQAAEAGLITAEYFVQSNGFTLDELQPDDCTAGNDCFETTCTNGRCFHGVYDAGDKDFECVLSPPAQEVWEDPTLDVWNDTSKHKTVSVSGITNDVKYIIEFMCYVDNGNGQFMNDLANPSTATGGNGAELYRISALGTGQTGRTRVLLQSVYRKN